MARPEKVRLGEILVQQKLLSEEQLQFSLTEQKRTGRKLGRVFIEQGFVTEEQISGALAKQLNIPYINLKFYNVNPDVVRQIPETQARRFRAIALEDRGGSLLIGMADPTDLFAYDEIARTIRKNIELAVVNEGELLQVVDRIYRKTEEITDFARELAERRRAKERGARRRRCAVGSRHVVDSPRRRESTRSPPERERREP